jgi:DNA-binding transcriptional regulator/RsmH inhibitor MraZ
MDPKNRVSIHPDFRPTPGEKVFLLSAETYDMPVLRVLNTAEYDRRVAIVRNSDKSEKDKTRILGKFASRCHEASINDQGKLLISRDLVDEIKIEAEGTVWLVGRQSYFEIWSEKNYVNLRKIEKQQDDDDLGVLD